MTTDDAKKVPEGGSPQKEQRGIQAALQAYLDESHHPIDTTANDDAWDDIEDFLHAIDDSLAAFDLEELDAESGFDHTDAGSPARPGTYPNRASGSVRAVPEPPVPVFEDDDDDEGGGTQHGVPAADLVRDLASFESSRLGRSKTPAPSPPEGDAGGTFNGVAMPPVARAEADEQPDEAEVAAWDAFTSHDDEVEAPAEADPNATSGRVPEDELQTPPPRYDVPTAVSEEVPQELLRSLHMPEAQELDSKALDARRREAEEREAARAEAVRQETLRREAEYRELLRREQEERERERKLEAQRREAERRAQYEARQSMLQRELEHREMLRRQELLMAHQDEVARRTQSGSHRVLEETPPAAPPVADPRPTQPVEPPKPAEPTFEDLKNDGLEALLDREMDKALELFKRAHELRPEDVQVRANLDRLAALGYQ